MSIVIYNEEKLKKSLTRPLTMYNMELLKQNKPHTRESHIMETFLIVFAGLCACVVVLVDALVDRHIQSSK